VIDIAPTIYEAVGVPAPRMVNGIEQRPIEGVSMLYSFDNATAMDTRKTQYFEMIGNRAIYHDGWFAGTIHKAPWEATPRRPLAEDVRELYNIHEDFSMAHNLAGQNPQKLEELKRIFMDEAVKFNVLPIDDRSIERFDPKIAGRPDLMGGRKTLTLYPGMTRMMENAFINLKNVSHIITADVNLSGDNSGVLVCQGGDFGGWSLYLMNGKPTFAYNWLGIEHYSIASGQRIRPGQHTIQYEFSYEGGGRGKGGTARILVDGVVTAEGTIAQTHANVFGLDEPASVGIDTNTPVTEVYAGRSEFSGLINKITIEITE
jgi:arylsulfatase